MENRKLDSQTLFYICFGLWYFAEILFKSTLSLPDIENYMTYFVSFLLFIQIVFFQTYEPVELFRIVLISLLVVVITINSQEFNIMSAWLFIVAFKDADLDHTIKLAFKLLTIGIIAIMSLCAVGFIPDYTMYRGTLLRHSMGFAHPNYFGRTMFQWALCYCYLRWGKLSIADILLLLFLAFFVYKVADSQTAIICILLLILFIMVTKCLEALKLSYRLMMARVCFAITLIIVIGSFILTWIDVEQNISLKLMDIFLSRRFYNCHRVLKMYGWKLFGNYIYLGNDAIDSIGLTSRIYLDNSYVGLWLRYGLVFACIFIVNYCLLYKTVGCVPKIAMILLAFSFDGLMGSNIYKLFFNVFLLLFAYILYPTKVWPNSFEPLTEL